MSEEQDLNKDNLDQDENIEQVRSLSDEELDKQEQELLGKLDEEPPATDKGEESEQADLEKSDKAEESESPKGDNDPEITEAFIKANSQFLREDGTNKLDKFKGKKLSDVFKSYNELETRFSRGEHKTEPEEISKNLNKINREEKANILDDKTKFQESLILNDLRTKHAEILEDYPDAFESLYKFNQAITDLTVADRIKSDELLEDFKAFRSDAADTYKIAIDTAQNQNVLNAETVNGEIEAIKKYLADNKLTAEDLGVNADKTPMVNLNPLDMSNPKANQFILDLLKGADGNTDASILDKSFLDFGIKLVGKGSLLSKFQAQYGNIVSQKHTAKAVQEAIKRNNDGKAKGDLDLDGKGTAKNDGVIELKSEKDVEKLPLDKIDEAIDKVEANFDF